MCSGTPFGLAQGRYTMNENPQISQITQIISSAKSVQSVNYFIRGGI